MNFKNKLLGFFLVLIVSCMSLFGCSNNGVMPKSFSFKYEELELSNGQFISLKQYMNYEPEDATLALLTYTADDPSLVKFDQYAGMTALAVGETTIHATNSNKNQTSSMKIKIVEKIHEFEPIQEHFELKTGQEIPFMNFVTEEGFDRTLISSSKDETIAIVENEKLIGINPGETEIKVTCNADKRKTFTISVKVNRYEMDEKYSVDGNYEFSSEIIDFPSDLIEKYKSHKSSFSNMKIYYPSELKTSNKKYPIVILSNGTGYTYNTKGMPQLLAKFSSYGFIAIGNDQENDGQGGTVIATIENILRLNKDSNSIFYNKFDESKIGVMGYSQGANGAINAAGAYEEYSPIIKSILPFCPTSIPKGILNGHFNTSFTIDKVKCPMFLFSGTGSFDLKILSDYEFDLNKENVDCYYVTGRIERSDHQYEPAVSYMIAWFLHTLLDDEKAAKVFVGEDAEILKNERRTKQFIKK